MPNKIKSKSSRWFIWSIVAIVVVGVLLVTYINYVNNTDDYIYFSNLIHHTSPRVLKSTK